MAKFFYKALKDQKELVTGYIEAETQQEARNKVRQLGFLPTNIYEETRTSSKKASVHSKVRLSLADKIAFTSELQTLLSSGISTLEALESVAKYSPKPKITRIAEDLEADIKSGANFSEALEKYSSTFGNIYVALCYAGETSGSLPAVLDYLLVLLRKQDSLKGKFIQMSIYPSILVVLALIVYLLMGGLAFPRLIYMLNIENVPPMVSIVTDSVSFLFKYWSIILVFCLGALYGVNLLFGLGKLKKTLADFVMRIPVLSDCVKYFSLSHYMSVMHIAYDSGIPILKALEMANSAITNDNMRKRAEIAAQRVAKGQTLTEGYAESDLIPGVLMPLISTGEKTGKMGQMFRDASIAIEKNLDMALGALARAFEPTLMIVIGLMVGYFVIAFVQIYGESISALGSFF